MTRDRLMAKPTLVLRMVYTAEYLLSKEIFVSDWSASLQAYYCDQLSWSRGWAADRFGGT